MMPTIRNKKAIPLNATRDDLSKKSSATKLVLSDKRRIKTDITVEKSCKPLRTCTSSNLNKVATQADEILSQWYDI